MTSGAIKPSSVLPSREAAPSLAFQRHSQKPIWLESFSSPKDSELSTRRYVIGAIIVYAQTICQMERPIRLWRSEDGGSY